MKLLKSRLHYSPLRLPYFVLAAVILLAVLAAILSHTSLSVSTVFIVMQNASLLALLALAVGLTLLVGEFDLSTITVYAFGGLIAVKLGSTSPVIGILAAVLAGAAIGLVQGLIIAKTRISSVPLTLGGYLTLLGACYLLGGGGTLSFANYDVAIWLSTPIAWVFSPESLIVIGVFIVVGVLLARTRLGHELRAVGSDRRASRAAGVNNARILAGVFTVSGTFSALGGALFAYSISAAASNLGLAPFIFAITSALLGGVALAGGRGTVAGIFIGVLALSLLEETFTSLGTASYMVDILRGVLLVAVVLVEAPDLRRRIIRFRVQRASALHEAQPSELAGSTL